VGVALYFSPEGRVAQKSQTSEFCQNSEVWLLRYILCNFFYGCIGFSLIIWKSGYKRVFSMLL